MAKTAATFKVRRSSLTLFTRRHGFQPFCQRCRKPIAEGAEVVRKVRRRGCGAKRLPPCVYWHRECFEQMHI